MKKLLAAALALACAASASAQGPADEPHHGGELLNLSTDVRVDYQHLSTDSHTSDANSGFEGKYFMLRLDGEIIPGLSYSWRQRLNKLHSDSNFFDATDWVYLDWALHDWNFSAGKQIVAIGGWEYDRNPMDLYGTSLFWQNIACYQLGASVAYHITPADQLKFQVTQSPSHTTANRNLYAYNLLWTGSHGIYTPIFSANLIEYASGHYINYIALGNRFALDKCTLELDLMNRACSGQSGFIGKDYSIMAELAWHPTAAWCVHGKYTRDENQTSNGDVTVLPGTAYNSIGAGVEFYPLSKKITSLRLHATAYYGWGHNANSADLMQDKSLMINVGIKWHMNIFSLKHK